MSKKILIVDDDPKICNLLSDILKENDFTPAVASTTEEGWDQVIRFRPDVVLLDVEIPLKGGLEFCRELKEKDPYRKIPVIFLTVRDQEMDRVSALNLGGDDFIVKPFRQQELIARISVAMRRSQVYQAALSEVNSGTLSINFEKRTMRISQKSVHITPKEMDLLKLLLTHRDRVLTDREIFEEIWGSNCNSLISTVYTHINRLRKKLKEHSFKIKTIPGVGFRFEERKSKGDRP